ncbi:hypothetical protein ACFQ0X_04755 [Streptomyces rectiviolaceus]|uniref:Uncharacterized protein n=1 Tax=Streptomyces rectiviolaceus TaxID=332591 RepID=A0ABP6M8S0_9ACTN
MGTVNDSDAGAERDPDEFGADPRGAIGDEPVSRGPEGFQAPAPGLPHGEAWHKPGAAPTAADAPPEG